MATDPTFDLKSTLAGIQSFEDAARTLRDIPELRPIAQRMLAPFFNGNSNGHAAAVVEGPMRGAPVERKKRTTNKPHWTQLPENAAKVAKMMRKAQRARRA